METKWHSCDLMHINCQINPKLCKQQLLCNVSINNVKFSYSTKVEDHLHWAASKYEQNKKNLPLFGIELELETTPVYTTAIKTPTPLKYNNYTQLQVNEAAKLAFWKEKFKKYGLIKSDGSLVYGGEFVTTPQSYIKTYECLMDFGEMLQTYEQDCTLYASSRCGLHIHTSKPSNITIRKLLLLWNTFPEILLSQIARRSPNTYCLVRTPTKTMLKSPTSITTDKYTTVNTAKPHTIEFRSFAATTKTNQLLSSLEFVHSSITFCETTNIFNILPSKYMEYLENNKKEYPYAYEQLKRNKPNLNHLIKHPTLNKASPSR